MKLDKSSNRRAAIKTPNDKTESKKIKGDPQEMLALFEIHAEEKERYNFYKLDDVD